MPFVLSDPQCEQFQRDGYLIVERLFDREFLDAARTMLIAAAAQKWDVDASECHAADGKVVHAASKRTATFGSLAEAAAKIPPPQVKPFEVFVYSDQDQRSPFVPQLQALANNTPKNTSTTGLHPDFNRNREYLEQFPLDGLKMVGTLTVEGSLFGLVKDSDNILHRVSDGNYMGQNYGKIISITDSEIKLREIVPDGQGGWSERVTTVTLSD